MDTPATLGRRQQDDWQRDASAQDDSRIFEDISEFHLLLCLHHQCLDWLFENQRIAVVFVTLIVVVVVVVVITVLAPLQGHSHNGVQAKRHHSQRQ